jgi:hypothetical protein
MKGTDSYPDIVLFNILATMIAQMLADKNHSAILFLAVSKSKSNLEKQLLERWSYKFLLNRELQLQQSYERTNNSSNK